MKEILRQLCADRGVSGNENEMLEIIKKLIPESAETVVMNNGSIIVSLGDRHADKHIMLDAHIDRIGLIVTYIDDRGFLCAEPVGGIDLRTLPGSAVRILGRETVLGVICTMPPHLDKDKVLSKDKIRIDTGLPAEKVRELIEPGDRIILYSKFTELIGNRVAVSALDNRSGCAVLIRCMRLLENQNLPCRVSFVFSAQEETNESGAAAAAFELMPDEAVVIDVGFAAQNGVPEEKSGKLGCGGIISISPVLSREVTEKLRSIAERLDIKVDYEVCGGSTGTNADKISVCGGGIKTGVISVPSKNMHTQTEIVETDDIEKVARLLTAYITEGGAENA